VKPLKAVTCKACEGRGELHVVDPDYLRATRRAAGLSLREVARRCGISAAYLSDIELGRRNCSTGLLASFQGACGKWGGK
jgi:DNA-binding transcriptional regulator YiaG